MLRKEEKNMGNIEIKTREEKKQREKAYYEEAPQIGGRRPSRIRQQINRGNILLAWHSLSGFFSVNDGSLCL